MRLRYRANDSVDDDADIRGRELDAVANLRDDGEGLADHAPAVVHGERGDRSGTKDPGPEHPAPSMRPTRLAHGSFHVLRGDVPPADHDQVLDPAHHVKLPAAHVREISGAKVPFLLDSGGGEPARERRRPRGEGRAEG